MKGIDVAKWNGAINWSAVKADGVEFVILKVIDKSGSAESAFVRNYSEASAQELPIGVYNYSYATTVAKAQVDAAKVVRALAGRKIQCKVWLDVEDTCQKGLGKVLINIIQAYQKMIKNAGYEFGVYTGLSFYNSYIKPYANMFSCDFWIARYPSNNKMALSASPLISKKPAILHPLWGWQYTSKGSVNGISGNVDINIMYAKINHSAGQIKPSNPYAEPTYTLYRYRPLMSREFVKWLQYELNDLGYVITIDGIFGKATDLALRSAQSRCSIAVDGKCGTATRTAIKTV